MFLKSQIIVYPVVYPLSMQQSNVRAPLQRAALFEIPGLPHAAARTQAGSSFLYSKDYMYWL